MREYSIGTVIDLAASLPATLIERLSSRGSHCHFAKGQVIYRQGTPADDAYMLLSGQAKSILVNSGGGECLLRIHLAHSILGLTALASRAERDAEAIATDDCVAVRLPRDTVLALLASEPEFAVHVTRLLVDRMSDFHHRVGDFLAQNVEQRLAGALLSLSRPDPQSGTTTGQIEIRLTHEDLARLLGARRPTVTAILNRFAADGLIKKHSRSIEIVDPERLAHLLPRGG